MSLWLQQVYALTRKDLRRLARDRSGLITLFVMPAMFILVMSVALQGAFETGSAARPVDLPVVNLDQGAPAPDGSLLRLGEEVVAALSRYEGLRLIVHQDGAPLTPEQAEALVLQGKAPAALILPPDFSASALRAATQGGAPPTATLLLDPGVGQQVLSPLRAAIRATVARVVAYAQAPYRVQAALRAAAPTLPPEAQAWVGTLQQALATQLGRAYAPQAAPEVRLRETAPAGNQPEPLPDAVQQNVPGYTVFGVFFIVGVVASSILDERRRGTLRRLQAAPFSRGAFLLGKVVPYFLVNLVQVALMFALGAGVFHMGLGHSPSGLALVSLATAAAATGLGLLVAALGRTEGQVGGISTLLALVLAAVGGMMVPVFVMPPWMQHLARLSPHYWALRGYQDLIVRGQDLVAVLPETGILLGFAALFYALAVWRFRLEQA